MGSEAQGAGLCATCIYRRDVRGARSTFILCERSLVDARFPRYPPLPVVACAGHDPGSRASAGPGAGEPGGGRQP